MRGGVAGVAEWGGEAHENNIFDIVEWHLSEFAVDKVKAFMVEGFGVMW